VVHFFVLQLSSTRIDIFLKT